MSLEPGQTLDGKYKVGRLIGEGGMGTVYEGENARIGRRVAIKVLHANVAQMPEFAERFEREARAAARIGSPHVCDVLDLGDLPGGDRYIVMEFLDGVSFEDRIIQKGRLTPAELAPIAFELLEGLGTMHNARVVHRDLKPANVFLQKVGGGRGRGETVKILDFGVAKLLPFEGEVGTMTKTGSMMGTPLYMSPEQARGARDVDGRTDLYAASVMFYRALCGELPYMADTLNELLFKIVLEDPKPLVEMVPGIDETFAAIIHKGLARDVDQRFTSAREYQEEIAAWGKMQGRTSLQFAVTLPSDPPPFLSSVPKQSAAKPADSKPKTAPAVSATSTAAGTPIAWTEDAKDSAQTKMSGRGAMGSSPELKSDGKRDVISSSPGSDVSPVASTVVSAGSPDLPVAQATTAPSADQIARDAQARAASKNKLIIGAVAAIALFAGIGIVVAKSAGGDAKTPGQAPASVEAPKDPTPPPTAAATTPPPPTTEPVDPAPPPSTTPSASTPPTNVAVSGPKPTGPHQTTGRTPEPKPTASAAPPATTSAPATTASAATPKPAASTRKFRTNID